MANKLSFGRLTRLQTQRLGHHISIQKTPTIIRIPDGPTKRAKQFKGRLEGTIGYVSLLRSFWNSLHVDQTKSFLLSHGLSVNGKPINRPFIMSIVSSSFCTYCKRFANVFLDPFGGCYNGVLKDFATKPTPDVQNHAGNIFDKVQATANLQPPCFLSSYQW